jgi:hypothetical protein
MNPKASETATGSPGPRRRPAAPAPVPAFPRAQSAGGRLPAQHPDVPPAAPGVPPCPRDEAGAEGVAGRSAGRAPGPSVGESEPADGPGVKGAALRGEAFRLAGRAAEVANGKARRNRRGKRPAKPITGVVKLPPGGAK